MQSLYLVRIKNKKMKIKVWIKRSKETFTLRVNELLFTFNYKDTTEAEQVENLKKLYENK